MRSATWDGRGGKTLLIWEGPGARKPTMCARSFKCPSSGRIWDVAGRHTTKLRMTRMRASSRSSTMVRSGRSAGRIPLSTRARECGGTVFCRR